MKCHRVLRRWLRLPAFLALGLAWFVVGVLFEKTVAMRRIKPLPGPGPAALVQASRARQAVSLVAEFESKSAVVLGASELVVHKPVLFGDLAEALAGETVIGLVATREQELAGRGLLAARGLPLDAVRFLRLPVNTMWVRDYGPLFVRGEGGLVMAVDAEYRGPEGRSDRWRDDELPLHLARLLQIPVRRLPLRLDGGNLLGNADGLAVATTKLLQENLEDGLEMRDVRVGMARQLGLQRLSLVDPLVGEPTGHVDIFLSFLAPDLALIGEVDPRIDPENAAILDHTASVLEGTPTSLGPLRVRRIPLIGMPDGTWRSYSNVILTDRKVLVPVFSDVDPVTQECALALYGELLPGREVVPVSADSLSYSGGFLHCISITVPGGVELLGG
jgi:agmatine/peptidylarginine deiminase